MSSVDIWRECNRDGQMVMMECPLILTPLHRFWKGKYRLVVLYGNQGIMLATLQLGLSKEWK